MTFGSAVRWALVSGTFSLGALGCATALYSGPNRSDAEVTKIEADGFQISEIDGVPIRRGASFSVLPGNHWITVFPENALAAQRKQSDDDLTLCFASVAGRTYVVRPRYVQNRWSPEIVDEKTAARISAGRSSTPSTCPMPGLPIDSVAASGQTPSSVPAAPAAVQRIDGHRPGIGLNVRAGYALGGDTLVRVMFSNGTTNGTLDAGEGIMLSVGGTFTPLRLSEAIGFGGGLDLGFKYGSLRAGGDEARITRYPLVAFLHVAIRLAPRLYLLPQVGLSKEMEVHFVGVGIDVDLTSRPAFMGGTGLYYSYNAYLGVDCVVRYTPTKFVGPGPGSVDASNVGVLIGGHFKL